MLSVGAPPPALSAGSAMTTGPSVASVAAFTPSATDRNVGIVFPRIDTIIDYQAGRFGAPLRV